MGFFRTLLLVVAVLAVLLGVRLARVDVFRSTTAPVDQQDWKCVTHSHLPASEDLVVDRAQQNVYISSLDFACVLAHDMAFGRCPQGFVSRLRAATMKPEKMEIVGQPAHWSFYPHGLSIYNSTLFVINHSPYFPNGNGVSVFKIADDKLIHQRDVVFDGFVSLNAVAAVSDTEFFVCNDRAFPGSPLVSLAEDVLGLKYTSVFKCKDKGCITAITGLESVTVGLEYHNGRLYVVQALSSQILVYSPDFQLLTALQLDTAPDNIHFDDQGRLWAGCHPKILHTFKHLLTGSKCPSHVIRSDDKLKFETVYYTEESDVVNGVSTGLLFNDHLLLGTMRDGFAVCKK